MDEKKIKKDKMTMIRQRYQLIVVVFDATFSWRLSPSKKSKKIDCFYPVILSIEELYNLTGWEAIMNQKCLSQMLTFFVD